MKQLLLLFLFSLPLTALGMERIPEGRLNLGPTCWEEEVRSDSSVPIPEGEGSRTVCGPNYWGESALDRICAEEVTEGETVYQHCYRRRPEKVESERGFHEVMEYRRGPLPYCGFGRFDEEELVDETGSWNILLPPLFAHGELTERNFITWEEADLIAVSDALFGTATRMLSALARGDSETEGQGSDHQMYFYEAIDVALVLSYLLTPGRNVTVDQVPAPWRPQGDLGLLSLLQGNFFPRWCTRGCNPSTLAFGSHLNSIAATGQNFTYVYPSHLGLLTATMAHEMYHLMFHYVRDLYAGPYEEEGPDRDFEGIYQLRFSRHGWVNYEDEASADIIGALIYFYLPPSLQEQTPATDRMISYRSFLRDLSLLLMIGGPAEVRMMVPFTDHYAVSFFWEEISEQRRAHYGTHSPCNDPSFCGNDYSSLVDSGSLLCTGCITGEYLEEEFETWSGGLLYLEGQIYASGGPSSLTGHVGSAVRRSAVTHSSYHHDQLAGPSGLSAPGGGVVGDPPPPGFSPTPRGHLGQEGAPPQEGDPIDPDCLYGGIRNCAVEYCFENFSGGLDNGGLCERTTDELCYGTPAPDYCAERCSAANGLRGYCDELCVGNPSHHWCDDLCAAANGAYGFCDDLCQQDHRPDFCDDLCNQDRTLPFCRDACRNDSDPNYCGHFCRENPNEPWCDNRCDAGVGWSEESGYCQTLCNENPSQTRCGMRCRENPHESWCDDRCRAGQGWGEESGYCRTLCQENPNQDFCEEHEEQEAREIESCVSRCLSSYCHTDCDENCPDLCRSFCAVDPARTTFPECSEPPDDDGCPGGWSEPRFDSLERAVDGCFPYIGNISCCGVNCEPVPGDDHNFACTEGSWCGCYENLGVIRRFNNCVAPVGGPWNIYERSSGYRSYYGGVNCRIDGDGYCDCWSSGGRMDFVECPGGYRSMAQCRVVPYP